MKVFSFCIFGNSDKYLIGLLKNIEIIRKEYPDFHIYVYIGNDVSEEFINRNLIAGDIIIVKTCLDGLINTAHRFFPIDNPDVEIMIVRDADSRIHERDRLLIAHFIHSDYTSHIIRDHYNHRLPIMAGMWGLKRGALHFKIKDVYDEYYNQEGLEIKYGTDQDFLEHIIYPNIANNALIHTSSHICTLDKHIYKLDIPVVDNNFVGNAVHFNEDGTEYNTCPYFNKI
jgi:hypothetical protein